jgi:hypothetical protein
MRARRRDLLAHQLINPKAQVLFDAGRSTPAAHANWQQTNDSAVLTASNSVDASVGNLRAEIEDFLNKVAV